MFLSLKDVEKSFGSVKAVDGVSMDIKRREIAGLVGSNGAGKTTLFNLITGFLSIDSGEIIFSDKNITGLRSHEISRQGIVRTFQIPRELSRMSVMENMLLAPKNQVGESWWKALLRWDKVKEQENDLREKAESILEFFELSHLKDEYAGALSGGQKKLLEMSRALMLNPELILLDEPFAGVNPTLTNKLIDYLKELRDDGLTFIVIEHDLPVIDEITDHIFVMEEGRIISKGNLDEIRNDERVLETYLGEEL